MALRDDLLAYAHRDIEIDGHERLSLRGLASKAGVAPSAPYRHFKDRSALLQALADSGFARLVEEYERARLLNAPPHARLRLAIDAFIGLAMDRPALFQLMFVSDTLNEAPRPPKARQSFLIFEQMVAEALGVDSEKARLASISLWAALHGAALLHRTRRITGDEKGITLEAVIDDIVRRFAGS